jgi:hypothetical protein
VSYGYGNGQVQHLDCDAIVKDLIEATGLVRLAN